MNSKLNENKIKMQFKLLRHIRRTLWSPQMQRAMKFHTDDVVLNSASDWFKGI